MDLNKLTTGDKVLAGSGIALLIFSFLQWFNFGDTSHSGWHYVLTGIVPTLIGLLLVGYVVATKLLDGVDLPDLPVGWPLVVLGLASLAALLVILRLLIGGDDNGADTLDRSYGLFLATLAAIGLAAGAFLKFQEDGGAAAARGGNAGPGTGTGSNSGSTDPTPF